MAKINRRLIQGSITHHLAAGIHSQMINQLRVSPRQAPGVGNLVQKLLTQAREFFRGKNHWG